MSPADIEQGRSPTLDLDSLYVLLFAFEGKKALLNPLGN